MKKLLILALCLALALPAAAFAGENLYETLARHEWSFSSGAGGWSTDLRIQPDGTFTGEYHDSEMGEAAETYPEGTVYFCSFSGKLAPAEQVDEYTWKVRVEKLEKDPGEEAIDGGIRFVPSDVYGLSEGDEMMLYAPGKPVNGLSEEMQMWAHVTDQETPPTELETWFLCSEKNSSGFVGFEAAGLANPWEELTAEELTAESGLTFGVPEGAKNVLYRYLRSEGLAEMQFTVDSDEYCARIQPAKLNDGEIPDISGMYYTWENVEDIQVGACRGILGQAKDGDTGWAELCRWYDADRGLAYSLSVITPDPDGLDLTAVADQVCGR